MFICIKAAPFTYYSWKILQQLILSTIFVPYFVSAVKTVVFWCKLWCIVVNSEAELILMVSCDLAAVCGVYLTVILLCSGSCVLTLLKTNKHLNVAVSRTKIHPLQTSASERMYICSQTSLHEERCEFYTQSSTTTLVYFELFCLCYSSTLFGFIYCCYRNVWTQFSALRSVSVDSLYWQY